MRRDPATRYHPRPLLDEPGPPWVGIVCAVVLIAAVVAAFALITGDTGRPEDPLPTIEPHSAPSAPGESAAPAQPASPAASPQPAAVSTYDDGRVDEHDLAGLLTGLDADDPVRPLLSAELLTRVAVEVCPMIPEHVATVEQLADWLDAAAATPAVSELPERDRHYAVHAAVTVACWTRWAHFARLA